MKTCITCKHFRQTMYSNDCLKHIERVDPVNGFVFYENPRTMRESGQLCGPTGIMHEPKPDSFLVRIIKWVLRIK